MVGEPGTGDGVAESSSGPDHDAPVAFGPAAGGTRGAARVRVRGRPHPAYRHRPPIQWLHQTTAREESNDG